MSKVKKTSSKVRLLLTSIFTFLLAFSMIPAAVFAVTPEQGSTVKVIIDFEGYNLEQGYYIQPTEITLPAGSSAADATAAILQQTQHAYHSYGNGGPFYLEEIQGFDKGAVNKPPYITNTFGNNNDDWLGEFDFTSSAGWMITVNHELIGTSAGSRILQSGDVVRGQFTVQGYGSDLGIVSGFGAGALYTHADKTQLIQALFTPNATEAAKSAALAVIINPLATTAEVSAAVTALGSDSDSGSGTDPGNGTGSGGTNPNTTAGYEEALTGVLTYLGTNLTNPIVGSVGGEWAVLAEARGGTLAQGHKEAYLTNLEAYLSDGAHSVNAETGKVVLHNRKYTDNSRVILALTSLGIDASAVQLGNKTYDFVSALTDKQSGSSEYQAVWQGINGPIFALMALDSNAYLSDNAGKTARGAYLNYILTHKTADDGWALSGSAADPDITGMALQALAPYYKLDAQSYSALGLVGAPSHADIKASVDTAISRLRALQNPSDGTFSHGTVASSESTVQVLVAISDLGVDGTEDGSFRQSVLANLLTYRIDSGAFNHTYNGVGEQLMATEQAAYALVAYDRFVKGDNTLYDMRDAFATETVGAPGSGDLDGNGFVEISELFIAVNYILKGDLTLSDAQLAALDVDNDGSLSITDTYLITKLALNL
jgi:hypothetical protein